MIPVNTDFRDFRDFHGPVGRGRSHCADGTGKQEGRRGATSVGPFLLRGPLGYRADRPTGTGGSCQVTLPKGRPALGGECPQGVLPSMSEKVEACWTPSMVSRQKSRLTNPNVSCHIPAGLQEGVCRHPHAQAYSGSPAEPLRSRRRNSADTVVQMLDDGSVLRCPPVVRHR